MVTHNDELYHCHSTLTYNDYDYDYDYDYDHDYDCHYDCHC